MKKLCLMVLGLVISVQIFGQTEIVYQQGKDGFVGFSDHSFFNYKVTDRKFIAVSNYHC